MEIWKIHKFCESTTLTELIECMLCLAINIEQDKLAGTNAEVALRVVYEHIGIKLKRRN